MSDGSESVRLFNTYGGIVETMVDNVSGHYVFAIVGSIGTIVVNELWTSLRNNRAPLINWRRKTVVRLMLVETLFLFCVLPSFITVTFY